MKKYVYHLSLSDGRAIKQEIDGLFVTDTNQPDEVGVLINSAVLIEVIEREDEVVEEVVVKEEPLEVEVMDQPVAESKSYSPKKGFKKRR